MLFDGRSMEPEHQADDVPEDVAAAIYADARLLKRRQLALAALGGLFGLACVVLFAISVRDGIRSAPQLIYGIFPLAGAIKVWREWRLLRTATPRAMLRDEARERRAEAELARERLREWVVTPWASLILAGGLALVGLAQYRTGSLAASIGAAGLDPSTVHAAEAWRFLTTGLLFQRPIGVFLSLGLLIAIGSELERKGRRHDLLLVFLVSMLATAAWQAVWSEDVLIGPFGGIFGLLMYGLVTVMGRPGGRVTFGAALEMCAVALVTVAAAAASGPARIGYLAGPIAGLVTGLLLQPPPDGATGPFSRGGGRTPSPGASAVIWPTDEEEDAQVASRPGPMQYWPRRMRVPAAILAAAGAWTMLRLMAVWPR